MKARVIFFFSLILGSFCVATESAAAITTPADNHQGLAPINGSVHEQHEHQLVANPRGYAPHVNVEQYHPEYDAYHEGFMSFLGGTPVLTSPYLGRRSEFDASDLIVNFSLIGEDVRLLNYRAKMERTLIDQDLPLPRYPLVVISGAIEADTYWQNPYYGDSTGDLDLARAELDVAAHINNWSSGMIVIDYDNSRRGPNRVGNSIFFVNNAFYTLGNLRITPVYFSAGQYYVPFGRYSSYTISSTLPKLLGRIKARAATLGYYQDVGLRGSVFAFPSDSNGGDSRAAVGGDLGYVYINGGLSLDVAASAVTNIADSDGMQRTGANVGLLPSPANPTGPAVPTFIGFGVSPTTERLFHRVPGLDLRATANYELVTAVAEYVYSMRPFDASDLNYNGYGAQPSALDVEAAYHFYVFGGKTASFALGYGRTFQALALNLPKSRISATLTANLLKDTTIAVEYRHDTAYDSNDFGSGVQYSPLSLTTLPGKHSDTITLLFGVYF